MTRRHLIRAMCALATLACLSAPASAWAIGEEEHFGLAILKHEATGWDVRKTALRRLLQEVEKRTSVVVKTEVAQVDIGPDLFKYPLIFMSGQGGFEPWSSEQSASMRTYLNSGGLLVIDSAEGVAQGPFLASVSREMGRIFGKADGSGQAPQLIGSEHVVFKSFYVLEKAYGRVMVTPRLKGWSKDDRTPVLLSSNDVMGAWSRDGFGQWEFDVIPGGERQREMSFRLGINLVMYALCINYKADQVHIPFILKRRKWKVGK